MTSGTEFPNDRIAQLEQQVAILSRALGVRYDDPARVVPHEIIELVRQGEKVKAIRRIRKLAGLDLVSAKRFVDATVDVMGGNRRS